ncbi:MULTISPECIES: replication initiation factor domain-containing protein [Enterococcus]|uniref:replication initiation factor domain-containing protein n=1 Tax=Enterococcus TaxID=1350 RepID=UPI002281EB3D|nr:replication initiation factor domain-containing protein [Enterococcus faecalis]
MLQKGGVVIDITKLKKYRLELGLRQEEVANTFNISRSYLGHIESGRRKCSTELFNELVAYYDELNQSEGLKAMLDYVRVRIPTNDIHFVVKDILLMEFEKFVEYPTGMYGYVELYRYGDIWILNSKKGDDRGVLIQLAGKGCRNYEYVMNELDQNWQAFFDRCFLANGIVKRIDVAIDDYLEYVSLPEMARKVERNEYDSTFKKVQAIQTYQNGAKEIGSEKNGATVYFGSRQSNLYCCFYQKNFEQAEKLGVSPEDTEVKNRYEVRFQNKVANKLIMAYLEAGQLLYLVRSVLDEKIYFWQKNRNGTTSKWEGWNKMLGATGFVDLSIKAEKPNFWRKLNYIRAYCGQILKMADYVGTVRGENYIEEIIEAAELNESNSKILEWELTEGSDLLSNQGKMYSAHTGEIISK